MISIFKTDSYKLNHREQYPSNTQRVFSNLTPRSLQHFNYPNKSNDDKIIVYGLSYTIEKLIEDWNENFFSENWKYIESEIKKFIKYSAIDITRNIPFYKALHELGYLPLEFKCIKDFTEVNINTPVLTIINTHDDFFWLVNYIETQLSSEAWSLMTCANISKKYYDLCKSYSDKTCDNDDHLPYQCHDFSQRGISSTESCIKTGLGHLAYFIGTDVLPAIIERSIYWIDREIHGTSIPASEHSVMCSGGKDTEFETYERFLDIYPSGSVSIVSDTWDYFNVLENYLPRLKDRILLRDGKIVIRPDSGDPVDMIIKSIPILDKIFGSTINSKGYKVLNPKIGLIYGDSITLHVALDTLTKLEQMGYASSNIVFGIGSYTYQYMTRDTLGFAIKATAVKINDQWINIFKAPKGETFKKSLKGFFIVNKDLSVIDDLSYEEYQNRQHESLIK
jgi:nicotinamide phosphoribosyltransferase